MADEVAKGLQEQEMLIMECGCYLISFDRIKKVSTASVCGAFQWAKKA